MQYSMGSLLLDPFTELCYIVALTFIIISHDLDVLINVFLCRVRCKPGHVHFEDEETDTSRCIQSLREIDTTVFLFIQHLKQFGFIQYTQL